MTKGYRALLLALATSLVATGAVRAQSECSIDLEHPSDLKNADKSMTLIDAGISRDNPRKQLQDIVKKLTEKPAKFADNPVGHDFVLGTALAHFAALPDQAPVAKRRDLGFVSEPEATVDILVAADSLLDRVDQQAGCAEQTATPRQRAWQPLVNRAAQLINADQLDSAQVLLQRANVIFDGLPYAYYYLAAIAQRQENDSAAAANFSLALDRATQEKAAQDSNVAQIREVAMYSLGVMTVQQAQKETGAAQQAGMKRGLQLLQAFVQEFPQSESAPRAKAIIPSLMVASGDTAAASQLQNDMVEHPENYNALQLFQAGTDAFSTDKALAARLLEAGLQKNPYYRPGLFNAVNTYYAARDFEKMAKVAERLVQVDPNNTDNIDLLAVAYDQLSQKTTDATQKKALHDSAAVLAHRAEVLPIVVEINEFQREGTAQVFAGSIQNKSKTAQQVTLRVDFLDESGKVVSHRDETVALPANGAQAFTIRVDDAPDIAAYRYAPLG
ncbi:MAG TPA: hypothetical protein VFK13_06935 [Gemmatimonadaceae bacterium]|nr:hypothetical protein [Gemmatimonadaceae bacterium]